MRKENSSKSPILSEEGYYAPEWAKHVIWYQIFPERFCNGDPDNDPTAERIKAPEGWKLSKWTGDWYEQSDWEKEAGPKFRQGVFDRRYGGDIQGIIDKLDYLQDLGIGGLYINPVFDAVSLHKYDASSFHHVDRFFGPDPEGDAKIMQQEDPANPETWQWTSADRLYLQLIEEVHRRGMKIIMDGVFNHTGTDFWAFRDVLKHQRESQYKDWYKVISFRDPPEDIDFDYDSWWGIKDLPEFREVNGTLYKPVREYIFAITRRWMDPNGDGDPSDGIDGWRLDVPEEIGMDFWKEWSDLVQSINPEAYTVGEIWSDDAPEFIGNDRFKAVMNYRFAQAVKQFLIAQQISATEFGHQLIDIQKSFPAEANLVVQNLMESHDTPRLASQIVNPKSGYDQGNTPLQGFDVRKPNGQERAVQRLIALFQYTYIGAPMLYYGTEAGMWGADDPDDRKPMVWPDMDFDPEVHHPLGGNRPPDENKFDYELFNWYKRLGEIRNRHEVLQTGGYKQLLTHDHKQIFVFVRYLDENEFCVVALNRSGHRQEVEVPLQEFGGSPKQLHDLLAQNHMTVENDILRIDLEPVSGKILMA